MCGYIQSLLVSQVIAGVSVSMLVSCLVSVFVSVGFNSHLKVGLSVSNMLISNTSRTHRHVWLHSITFSFSNYCWCLRVMFGVHVCVVTFVRLGGDFA
jgi:hypothetical protein